MWHNSKHWRDHSQIDHATGDYSGYAGVIPNHGSAGSRYDLPVIARWFQITNPAQGWTYGALLDLQNWPGSQLDPFVFDPREGLFPIEDNFLSPTFMTDIGGRVASGGPIMFCVYLTDQDVGDASVTGNSQYAMFDLHQQFATGFIGDNTQGELFQEWLDYVNAGGISNFSEIRGPDRLVTGYSRAALNNRLITIWQDFTTGLGDVLIDDFSLFTDPTWGGVYSGPRAVRGEIFWKFDPPGASINVFNDPESVWYDLDTGSRVHLGNTTPNHSPDDHPVRGSPQLFSIDVDNMFGLPAPLTPGDFWPGWGGQALFRGIPTGEQLREIKAAFENATLPFGASFQPDNGKRVIWRYSDPFIAHEYTYTVPAGVSNVRIYVRPALSLRSIGPKAMSFDVPVSPGDTIRVELGGRGGRNGAGPFGAENGRGGWPDGGQGGWRTTVSSFWGGGGAGSSRFYLNGTLIAIIAGSGGQGLDSANMRGGSPDALPGLDGNPGFFVVDSDASVGRGGTAVAPGARGTGGDNNSTPGVGSVGGRGTDITTAVSNNAGGGGGGGLFGGGGGGANSGGGNPAGAGGGAGSHWLHAMCTNRVTHGDLDDIESNAHAVIEPI
jgi:hypothetical protein